MLQLFILCLQRVEVICAWLLWSVPFPLSICEKEEFHSLSAVIAITVVNGTGAYTASVLDKCILKV